MAQPSNRTDSELTCVCVECTRFRSSRITDGVVDSPLFKLAPELRNKIYRYALVKNTGITISKNNGIPEPALLSACEIIFSEARFIFYGKNNFLHWIESWNPAACLLVSRKRASWKLNARHVCSKNLDHLPGGLAKLKIMVDYQRDWSNSVCWLLALQAG